jgi:glucose-1-phosphate thymidylyltransferase
MAMDRVVVLAAGRGNRMRSCDQSAQLSEQQTAVAETGVKALIPIGRPFLDYVLTHVADAGYRHVCLVIGPGHDELRQYYTQLSAERLQFSFAVQPEPLGTAHALTSAAEFVGDDPFAVINSDNFYPTSALNALRTLTGAGLVAFTHDALVQKGNTDANRVGNFATVETDPDGYLTRITEKPDPAWTASLTGASLINMNCWRFGPAILSACRRIDPSPRGEYEIGDAVTHSMQCFGERYCVVTSDEAVLDLSRRSDVEAIAKRLRTMKVRL